MASTGLSSSAVTSEAVSAQADIVVGLASCNDAATAGAMTAALHDGVIRHLAGASSRFVLADCGSTDGTVARVRDALTSVEKVVEVAFTPTTTDLLELPYHRIPGKARALRGILTTAKDLGARACVVLDAGIDTVTPQWLRSEERRVGKG